VTKVILNNTKTLEQSAERKEHRGITIEIGGRGFEGLGTGRDKRSISRPSVFHRKMKGGRELAVQCSTTAAAPPQANNGRPPERSSRAEPRQRDPRGSRAARRRGRALAQPRCRSTRLANLTSELVSGGPGRLRQGNSPSGSTAPVRPSACPPPSLTHATLKKKKAQKNSSPEPLFHDHFQLLLKVNPYFISRT